MLKCMNCFLLSCGPPKKAKRTPSLCAKVIIKNIPDPIDIPFEEENFTVDWSVAASLSVLFGCLKSAGKCIVLCLRNSEQGAHVHEKGSSKWIGNDKYLWWRRLAYSIIILKLLLKSCWVEAALSITGHLLMSRQNSPNSTTWRQNNCKNLKNVESVRRNTSFLLRSWIITILCYVYRE